MSSVFGGARVGTHNIWTASAIQGVKFDNLFIGLLDDEITDGVS